MSDAGSGAHHHRSLFKNKKNKPFKGKSKGKSSRAFAGRVDDGDKKTRGGIKSNADLSLNKNDRLNRTKLLQKQKRAELMNKRRLGSRKGPPKTVALVSISPSANLSSLGENLISHCGSNSGSVGSNPLLASVTQVFGGRERRFMFYAAPRDLYAILDICKVCDVLVLVAKYSEDSVDNEVIDIDTFGQQCITAIKAQGLPSVLCVYQGLNDYSSHKKQSAYKKNSTELFHSLFDNETRVINVDNADDCGALFRFISDTSPKTIRWRENRSYLLAQQLAFVPNTDGTPFGSLYIRGFLRGGRTLSANNLIHITGYGDFQIEQIAGVPEADEIDDDDDQMGIENNSNSDNNSSNSSGVSFKEINMDSNASSSSSSSSSSSFSSSAADSDAMAIQSTSSSSLSSSSSSSSSSKADRKRRHEPVEKVLDVANSSRQTLADLVPIDPLAHEQSIITEDEIAEAAAGGKEESKSYQNVWEEGLEIEAEEGEPDMDGDHEMKFDEQEEAEDDAHLHYDDDDDRKSRIVSRKGSDGDAMVDGKRKAERDELDYPDEVEFPRDTILKDRLQRYRGLKSFRNSHWDKNEQLPLEYSQIFQFTHFDSTMRRVMKTHNVTVQDDGTPIMTGVTPDRSHPISIHLINVPADKAAAMISSHNPIVLFSLFEFEHRVSLMHFLIKRQPGYDEPVRMKELMQFQCGFRRFTSRPIYSQHTLGDKHLCERYLQSSRFVVASVYGRIMFPPASVLMFKPGVPQGPIPHPLVASGLLMNCDPNRLLIKRMILTGHPISVHRRSAVVRYMFFNADDIRYFKPIELRTKHGLVGHIKEPRGTKGYMKCVFDKFIKPNDVVGMHLYKRQYPPFDSSTFP